MQADWKPKYPRLYSALGCLYCDLLLSRAESGDRAGLDGLVPSPEQTRRFREVCREVLERATQGIEGTDKNKASLLDSALNYLSLGRAHFGLARTAPDTTPGEEAEVELARSAEHLDRAVDGLRQAGREDYLPWGLLAWAALHRLRGDLTRAKTDLTEALEIAERGSMRLHECDAHLEWARLCLHQGDTEAAREHVVTTRKIVEETGYGRREREVGWLERKLAGEGGDRVGAVAPA